MKKILFSIICSCLLLAASAQSDPNRTTATKIADLLAKYPADDAVQFQANAEAMAALGEAGQIELARQLDAGGDDSKIRYAISGFCFSATKTGNEAWRSLATNAYGKTLSQLSNPEAKLFLLTQLQEVGKDDAIPYIIPFLNDARLSDPASRALATINTPEANQALLAALPSSSGTARISIIEALGVTAYAPAAANLLATTNSGNLRQEKVALHALAQIADPGAARYLEAAAAKAGYRFDSTEATAAYLLYLDNQLKKGGADAVGKKAIALQKGLKAPDQIQSRIALLKLIAQSKGDKSTTVLQEAMKDENIQYRQAALEFAKPGLNAAGCKSWLGSLKNLNPVAKSELINFLAANSCADVYPAALEQLKSSNPEIRASVFNAVAISGKSAAAQPLLSVLKNAELTEATAAKNALLLIEPAAVLPLLPAALPSATTKGKLAIFQVLGEKGVRSEVPLLLPYLKDSDADLREGAGKALEKMVGPENLGGIFQDLYKATDAGDQKILQSILISGINNIDSADQRSALLTKEFQSAPDDQKSKLYPVLAGVGGTAQLQAISQEYTKTNDAGRLSVISALGGWKRGEAAATVSHLSSQNTNPALKEALTNSFIQQIAAARIAPEQKYLLVRGMMESGAGEAQQRALLQQLGAAPAYSSLVYAGKFLNTPELQSAAATAVKDIALRNTGLFGLDVKQVVEKAIPLLKGPEADYEREALRKWLAAMPATEEFSPIFNGTDLSGWKGLVGDPVKRAKMNAATLSKEQAKADELMRKSWTVKDGNLVFGGSGENLATIKKYGDFEMLVDWKIQKDGDAGIYLRGTPQVQIWDTARRDVGAEVGSGGLYNNQANPSKPLVLADNAIGEWNQFRILMTGDQVTVYLNGQLVVDKVTLENFWDRSLPLYTEEQIELQAHGTLVAYRDILLREIPKPKLYTISENEKQEGFKVLFDGTSLYEWVGNKTAYIIEDGNIAVYPKRGGNGNLYTKDEYSDFIYRFEFKLTPGANNGVGIHAPLEGDAAYEGMEIQILDNDAEIYKNLQVYQYHGSVYGVIPARRGFLKPVGEWNEEEIRVKGSHITVTLNGTIITEGDYKEASKNGTVDHREHPGLSRTSGHIGFLGHGDSLYFRNIRVKDLSEKPVKKTIVVKQK